MLDVILDSWDRNNRILVNLLRLIPEDLLDMPMAEGSHTVRGLFLHIHGSRLFFVSEDAPEYSRPFAWEEIRGERDREKIAAMLDESAALVREAVRGRVESGKPMNVRYDHPILMIQHLLWHDAYHHGAIKLKLKLAGRALDDEEEAGPVTWDLWMDKSVSS